MDTLKATIATSITGIPEVGSEITIKGKNDTTKRRRVLIGWKHQNDTPDALDEGKLWCWVDGRGSLMVYDQMYNRSPNPGEVRFCGVANFTMVRMFHPFWSIGDRVPEDMVSEDKSRCRDKYADRIRRFRIQYGHSVSPEPDADPQATDANEEQGQDEPPRRGRDRGQRRGTGRFSGRGAHRPPRRRAARRRTDESVVTGREMSVPGAAADDPMEITDDSESNDSDTDVDTDTDGTTNNESDSNGLKPQLERPAIRAVREESTVRMLAALRRNHDEVKTEERAERYTTETASNVGQQESDVASEDDNSAVKSEDGQTGTGKLGDPIVVADGSDDAQMFFPEVNPDSVPGLSPTREFEIQLGNSGVDGTIDDPQASSESKVKKDLEDEEIRNSRIMEGPRELIVIDDD